MGSIVYWVLGHWVLGPYALDATSRATAVLAEGSPTQSNTDSNTSWDG